MTDGEKLQALSRRAVACEGFRWMPGMRDAVDGDRCIDHDGGDEWRWAGGGWSQINEGHEWLPDMDDPATLKLMPYLATEAWSKHWAGNRWLVPVVTVEPVTGGWRWRLYSIDGDSQTDRDCSGDIVPTEAEASVAALEAAP